jgi:hypothetical protein
MADRMRRLREALRLGSIIRLADRQSLGIAHLDVEELLAEVIRSEPVLLHGTGAVVPRGTALRLSPGRSRHGVKRDVEAFATDLPGIAILKALFSNRNVVLQYPMVVSPATPLCLTIKGWNPAAERQRGFVYLVEPRDKFQRERETWQWVTSEPDVLFGGSVEVERPDFKYGVIRQ